MTKFVVYQHIASLIRSQSIADLLRQAKARKISPMALAEMITDGHPFPELKTALKKNLGSFVGIVRKLRRAAAKVTYGMVNVTDHLGASSS